MGLSKRGLRFKANSELILQLGGVELDGLDESTLSLRIRLIRFTATDAGLSVRCFLSASVIRNAMVPV